MPQADPASLQAPDSCCGDVEYRETCDDHNSPWNWLDRLTHDKPDQETRLAASEVRPARSVAAQRGRLGYAHKSAEYISVIKDHDESLVKNRQEHVYAGLDTVCRSSGSDRHLSVCGPRSNSALRQLLVRLRFRMVALLNQQPDGQVWFRRSIRVLPK